jgi:ribosomal protein L11 methyltransferase
VDYIEITFTSSNADFTAEILAAFLGESGFEMFQESDQGVAAFIQAGLFDVSVLNALPLSGVPAFEGLRWTERLVPHVNWNAEWEKNFEPVTVNDLVHIRAEYHPALPHIPMEVVIRPGMAFGTGHHATTFMMVAAMLDMDLKGKKVLDMGTGSGVLAILADKLGAEAVWAVDYDENASENARINTRLNDAGRVEVLTGTVGSLSESGFNVILANINRNIITADIGSYASKLEAGGELLVSGFYSEDLELINRAAIAAGLEKRSANVKNNWCSATFRKNN